MSAAQSADPRAAESTDVAAAEATAVTASNAAHVAAAKPAAANMATAEPATPHGAPAADTTAAIAAAMAAATTTTAGESVSLDRRQSEGDDRNNDTHLAQHEALHHGRGHVRLCCLAGNRALSLRVAPDHF